MLACIGVAHVGTGTANAGKAIENLFIDPITNDQIYGIKFYNDNKETIYVTVNTELPVKNKSYSEGEKNNFFWW